GARSAMYDSLSHVLARLHTVDWRALGLADFGRPGNYFARQIHRWTEQYRASETEKIDAMERLIAWMPEHVPSGDETTLVHGDFRLGNVVIHPSEPRVAAVLDWELSTLGHPLADLAYNCLPYRFTREWEGLADKNLRELGIPTEEEYVAAYCRRTGRAGIPDWNFCLAFAMFRLAAIAQGIMGRAIAGTANDPNARERGARARPLAESAGPVTTVDHRRSERLVQLPDVDVADPEAAALEELRHREDRADPHLVGLTAGDREAAEDELGPDAELLRALHGHDERGRGAVGE